MPISWMEKLQLLEDIEWGTGTSRADEVQELPEPEPDPTAS